MSSEFFSEGTLFHVHTDWTDGQLTCAEYFEFAQQHRLERIIFLEHIRRDATYSCHQFAREVHQSAQQTGVVGIVGFETKVLSGGQLDIADDAMAVSQVIGIAEHGQALTWLELRKSLRQIFAEYPQRYPDHCFVWVHPGLYLHRRQLLNEHHSEYTELLQTAIDSGIRIEQNARYDLIDATTCSKLPQLVPVLGLDGHTQDDLDWWWSQRQG